MDSLLLIGSQDPKLPTFLKRLGYNLVASEGKPVTDVISSTTYDLILVDSRGNKSAVEFCEFLRAHDATKLVPIVCISDSPTERYNLKELHLDKLELADMPYSIGNLAARIATQVRLLKFAGNDQRTANLTEMNAALRELNKHFAKELEDARKIQKSLLTERLPQDPRYTVAATYQPLNEVGGDLYYVNVEPSSKLTLQVADVTGHGMSAALLGSMTRLALAAAGVEAPAELLSSMNRLLTPQLPEGRFVTVASLLYDPQSGELSCARAGHPPLFVWRAATGQVCQLKPPGFPLGFESDSSYQAESCILEPGDVALLITDGISEGQNRAHENYGFGRLEAALKKSDRASTAEDCIATLMKDFNTFLDGRLLKDDVTLVALKRT